MSHQPINTLASATRSVVLTQRGVVCSASPAAASAGLQVLLDGGNAFDAAVAVAAAEGVTLPPNCGMGGEVFALLYEASTGRLYDVAGSGRAPMAATREYFASRGSKRIPPGGPLSSSVPGEVHAWQTIVDRFGSRRLAKLLEPAILLAEEGFPLPSRVARYCADNLSTISDSARYAAQFVGRDGHPLKAGEVLVQRDLARSLKRVAQGGAEEFYRGALARELAEAVQAAGGLISTEDLARHTTEVREAAASTIYRGHTVYATAPPSQGLLILEVLNILEELDLAAMGHNSADAIHAMAEAAKLASMDCHASVSDPDFVQVPLERLISKEWAGQRRRLIDMKRAAQTVDAGALDSGVGASTSYFCVVDAQGNAASFVHSISRPFGAGFAAGETGILLNNRAGRGLTLQEGHVNALEPGKRTSNTVQAYMLFQDGKPVLVGGTPGGDGQYQWNVQVIANLLDYGMNLQEAAEAPRWHQDPAGAPATAERPYELRYEEGLPEESLRELRERGHNVEPHPETMTPGAVQLIRLDPATGTRMAASDSRWDGYPMAQ